MGLHPYNDPEYIALKSARSTMQRIYCELLVLEPMNSGIITGSIKQLASTLMISTASMGRALNRFQKDGLVYMDAGGSTIILFMWRWPPLSKEKLILEKVENLSHFIGEGATAKLREAVEKWKTFAPNYKRTYKEAIPPASTVKREEMMPKPWIIGMYENLWGLKYNVGDEETEHSMLVLQGYGEERVDKGFRTAKQCGQKDLGFVQQLLEGGLSTDHEKAPA